MKRLLLHSPLIQLNKIVACIFFLLASIFGFSQSRTITGVVTAGVSKELQPGVSVYEKGTSNGTISDASGSYTITVPEGAILVFSSIGFTKQEISVTNQAVINILLKEDTQMLDDVIVVGYGEQKRSNITGAVATVTVGDMQNKTQLRLDQALQGMVAGVTVARDGGSPGARPTIHIRGVGSISNTEPLWIVDGVRMDPGNQFEIDDVESMEVLKDAAAAAIYGVKAAHGVILVTTKRGKGEPRITFKTSISKRQPINLPTLLNSKDFVKYRKEGRLNAGTNPDPSWDNYKHDTDWMSAFYNGSGVLQSYDVSISKGDEKSNYFLSFAHDNEDGILIDNNFKRYSIRLNSDVKVSSWLKIGESVLVSRVTENPIGKNNENSSGAIPFRSIPIMPIHDPTNPYGGWGMGPAYFNGPNPVATQYQQHETKAYNRIDGNAYIEVTPLAGLSVKGTLGYNYFGFAGERFEEAFDYGSYADPINKLLLSSATSQSVLGNVVVTYSKTLDKHDFKIMGGYEGFKYDPSSLNATGTGYIVDVASSFNLTNGSIGVPDRYQPLGERMLSQFGRVNYSFNDRYLIEANIRRDAVGSKFAPENRWGVFPSISAGWRISEEEFFKDVPVINTLKLRASVGKLGSDNSSAFIWQSTYTTQFSTYAFDDKGTVKVPGYYISRFANRGVQWEEINVYNAAIDSKLLNNKLSFTFELYRRDTNKLLYPVQIPASSGIATHNFDPVSPQVNIGTLRNTGVDIELGYNDKFGDFQLITSGNVSFVKNKVISLAGDAYVTSGYGGDQIGGMSRTQPGHPISSFYGYIVQQMLNSDDEVYAINTYALDGNYQFPETGAGDLMYRDLNPTKANSEITADADRTFIGNPWPKMTYAFNIGVVFKNMFDVSMQFQGVGGVDIFNAGKAYTRNFFGDNNSTTLIKDAWRPENHTNNPRNIASDPNRNFGSPSTYFIESGAYLKLRNLQIGFTLPTSYLEKLNIKKLRVYANANNLLTLTKYTGPDPEIAGSNLSRGIDYGQYPQVRTFGAGLEVQF